MIPVTLSDDVDHIAKACPMMYVGLIDLVYNPMWGPETIIPPQADQIIYVQGK